MCAKSSLACSIDILGYSVPVFHEGSKCYVDFYAYDVAEERVRRKKYHLDNIKSKRARREYASRLITELTMKLSKGWRPWATNSEDVRGYTELQICFEKYLERVKRSGKKKTLHSYTSRVNILREYISTLTTPPRYVCQFNRAFVIDFLDWILTVRKVGPRTRNNYRNWLTVFSDFLIERKYIAENPVKGTEKMKERPKHRKPLGADMLRRVSEYLRDTDKHFLLAVLMEYYTFIRPGELSRIRLSDISIKRQSVFIPGESSKNGRDGTVALNETLILLMVELGVFNNPDNYYLFGKDFRPSAKKCGSDSFNKRWARLRKALNIGDEYQFYSLKDSGIRDLANTAGIVTAKRQARHSDISTTNKYLQGKEAPVPEEAKHFKGGM